MKILSKTETGFLLDATENELAQIMGYYGSYDDDYKEKYKKCRHMKWTGLNIPVSELYSSARLVMDGFDQQYSYKTLLSNLQSLQNEIELAAKIYNIPMREVKSND